MAIREGCSSKRYRLLAIDVDGVLTEVDSIWRFMHERLGTSRAARANMLLFKEGRISYEEWARLDAMLWRGTSLGELRRIVEEVKIREGARELVDLAHKEGVRVLAVSAGLDVIACKVARELGVDEVVTNELVVRGGLVTGEVIVRVTYHNKGEILVRACDRLGVSPEEAIAIGDSEVDASMMRLAGLSIAYRPSSLLIARYAHIVLLSETLTPLVELLRRFM